MGTYRKLIARNLSRNSRRISVSSLNLTFSRGFSTSLIAKSGHFKPVESNCLIRQFQTLVLNHETTLGLPIKESDDILVLTESVIRESNLMLKELMEGKIRDKCVSKSILYTVDKISNLLCSLADPAELLRHVHVMEDWRVCSSGCVERVSEFIGIVNINDELYNLLVSNYSRDLEHLTDEERLVLKHMIDSMQHQGVGLPARERERYLKLQGDELALSFEISHIEGLKHKPVVTDAIPENPALYHHILRNLENPKIRREIWYAQRRSTEDILEKLLRLRNIRTEIANIRGFKSYATCSQRECMMNGMNVIRGFLQRSSESIKASLMQDLEELQRFKADKCGDFSGLAPWDVDFLIARAKDEYDVTLSMDAILEYFKSLLLRLFNIDLVKNSNEKLWHPSVIKYDLIDKELNTTIAHLYLDLFERPNKANLCAQFTIRCSKKIRNTNSTENHIIGNNFFIKNNIKHQRPATAVVCNFHTPDVAGSLLSSVRIDMMSGQTLFHELGHTLHTLLSETEYQHLSGNRGGTDFAEFSSHLFELFYMSGLAEMVKFEGLPEDCVRTAKLQLYKFQSIDIARMILAAYLDQVFYDEDIDKNTWINIEDKQEYSELINIFNFKFGDYSVQQLLSLPAISNFDHLVHYGGTYFCYIYSRILAKGVWNTFSGVGEEVGCRLRRFLSEGSVDSSLRSIEKLSGREMGEICDLLFDDNTQ